MTPMNTSLGRSKNRSQSAHFLRLPGRWSVQASRPSPDRCNNEKRDRLTNMDVLERLCARNQQIAKQAIATDSKFLRHFAEWHSRDLSSHIKGLYDQAIADKFPKWK